MISLFLGVMLLFLYQQYLTSQPRDFLQHKRQLYETFVKWGTEKSETIYE